MERIATWSSRDRRELFQETASRRSMNEAVVEKDFWVCWTLGRLFSAEDLADRLLFKGGTTLSKIFGLIDRFSEDVDLVLKLEDADDADMVKARSKTRQKKYLEQIRADATEYIQSEILPALTGLAGDICQIEQVGDEPRNIYLTYSPVFEADYIPPRVKLEIGPVALWTPNDSHTIRPYAAEEFPGIFVRPECRVQAVNAERTFWEKATILHTLAHCPADKDVPLRYSRHYYDLHRMTGTDTADRGLNDLELLRTVVEFKAKCYPSGWAHYETAFPGSFRLVPPEHVRKQLHNDYSAMQVMIHGNIPSFDEILENLAGLEQAINKLEMPAEKQD